MAIIAMCTRLAVYVIARSHCTALRPIVYLTNSLQQSGHLDPRSANEWISKFLLDTRGFFSSQNEEFSVTTVYKVNNVNVTVIQNFNRK